MIKVLAIDDEEPIRKWLQFCISRFDGFACITAASGKEGIALWQAQQPDIILSDIEMPGMSGLEMLKEIQSQDELVYSIVLTSHEDFAYARTALKLGTAEYMLKTEMTEDNLRQVLEKARSEISLRRTQGTQATASREHYLQALTLHGSEVAPSLEELKRQGLPLENAPVIALDFCGCSQHDCENLYSWLTDISNAFCFALEKEHSIIIANVPCKKPSTRDNVYKACEAFLAEAQNASCGISEIFASTDFLRAAIDEARYRCSLSFYEPDKSVFWRETAQDISPEEQLFQVEYIRLLLNQDFASAYKHLKSFISLAKQKMPRDIAAFKKTVISSVASFLHFAKDISEDADAMAQKAKQQITLCADIDGLDSAITAVLQPAAQLADTASGLTAPICHAIEYLEQHYAEKVTLGDIAERVAFSPEHFSRVFSKETGVNYVTYLNNLRMKHAVALLEATDMKVYEIAEKVGFFSLSYFSTAFKKKFGQNPYEYQVNFQRGKLAES